MFPPGARREGGRTLRVALLFPGQGSQTLGMRSLVEEHRPDLIELIDAELELDPFENLDAGTHCVQPALYAASIASWERAGRPPADLFAGHSLGELAALAAAGAIDERDGLRLAILRGALMKREADTGTPGGMLVVLGGADGATRLAGEHGLTVANYNGATQTVLSGPLPALEAATAGARELDLRTMRLPVHGAFHSPAMSRAIPDFRAALDEYEFRPVEAPVFSCLTAVPFEDPREQLAEAIAAPVRWRETLLAMSGAGAREFLEAGPGKVLTGMVRRELDGVEATSLDQPSGARA